MRRAILLLALLSPVPVFAQPAPIVATTVRTTDTSAMSLCVGGANGCASATGGIKSGAIDVASVTSAGFIGIASNVPISTTYRLYNNAGTLTWNGTPLAAGGSLSGTTGKLAKFTASSSVGDSICSESGTTITCVNTISATTLTGTLSTASQPNVTNASSLATVGTIGTGVWQGTKVGLAYGGTNADLSGTGGTSQFLRQNTLGGAVTVVRPAMADLSDGSTVPLLNAANSFTLINPLTTIAESWIGPSSTTGIYFKGGNVGIGTTSPGLTLDVNGTLNVSSPNITYTVAAAGGNYTTVQAALNAVGGMYFSDHSTVSITVNDGTYTSASPINIAHSHSQWFTIQGQHTYSHTLTSVQSSSGGAGAWTLVLNLDSVSNMAIGDYIVITSPSGGSNPTYLAGAFPVTNVDVGNTRVTVASTHQNTTAPSGAVGGTVTVIKSVLKFTGSDGFRVWTKSGLVLKNIVVVGDGTASTNGLSVQDLSRLYIDTMVAVVGFGADNVLSLYNSQINGDTLVSSGGSNGLDADDGSSISLANGVSSGNSGNGVIAQSGGVIKLFAGVSTGNGNYGINAIDGGVVVPSNVTASGNTLAAQAQSDGPGSVIDVSSLTGAYKLNNSGFTLGNNERLKTFTTATNSPADQLVITSNGATGGWQGAVDLNVSYNAGTVVNGLRVVANTNGTSANVGIGTTAPAALLSVGGAGSGSYTADITGTLHTSGLITVSGFGVHKFESTGTGDNAVEIRNNTAGTANRAYLRAESTGGDAYLFAYSSTYTTGTYDVQNGNAFLGLGVGGISVAAINASGAIRFYSGGTTLRWGVNAAGDWTFGTSSHIADSSGTPTCTASGGCDGVGGSIAGTDYAFRVVTNNASTNTATVTFGHTWSTTPVCVATQDNGSPSFPGVQEYISAVSTTSVSLVWTSSGANLKGAVICRGY